MQGQNRYQPDLQRDFLAGTDSIVVVGMGDTGRSCLKFLQDKTRSLIAMDSRTRPPHIDQIEQEFSNVELIRGGFDRQKLLAADLIVLSPGVSIRTQAISQARSAGVPVIGDIELFAAAVDKPVISITGSNGKSTVTALTGEMLKAAGYRVQVGGNFGQPALQLLDSRTAFYVLELSSFQLETTHNLVSQAAVILNITPDHMDRYASLEEYKAAKQRIFNCALTAVYNRADPHSYPTGSAIEKRIGFGPDEPPGPEDFGIRSVKGQQYLSQGDNNLVSVDKLAIKGRHNAQNSLAALALVYLVGADLKKAMPGLLSFGGLPHRFEYVGEFNGVEWINDSKGTNPGATLASISGQHKEIVLIIGGDAKGADFSILSKTVREHVKAVVLFGRDIDMIKKILPSDLPCLRANNLKQAVQMADELASETNMVLFSPACASFDMFDNYEQRGEAFKQAVREYFL